MSKNILVNNLQKSSFFFKWRKAKNKAAVRIFLSLKKLVLKVSFMKRKDTRLL